MGKQEKIGSDGYSREAFQAKLDELDALGIAYRPPTEERNGDEEWAILNEAAGSTPTLAALDRLHANALREAQKEDLLHEYSALLPKIEEAKDEIHKTLAEVAEVAPSTAVREAGDVVRMGEELKGMLQSKKPVHPRSLVKEMVRAFIEAKDYIVAKLRKWLGFQDKYGGPYQPA